MRGVPVILHQTQSTPCSLHSTEKWLQPMSEDGAVSRRGREDIKPLKGHLVPPTNTEQKMTVPVGYWKDSLWDIFRYGYCHCSIWNSCCCTLIGAGQMAGRLHLTHLGQPGEKAATFGAFQKLVGIFLSFWTTRILLFTIIAILDPNTDEEKPEWIDPPQLYHILCAVDDMLAWAYFVLSVVVLRNLRFQVRSSYAIPESGQCPAGWEDTCCSVVCPCLVTGQMLRHTAEYEIYGGNCCSETGLSEAAPGIV